MEAEQIDRERRALEARAAMQNRQENTKWKKMQVNCGSKSRPFTELAVRGRQACLIVNSVVRFIVYSISGFRITVAVL